MKNFRNFVILIVLFTLSMSCNEDTAIKPTDNGRNGEVIAYAPGGGCDIGRYKALSTSQYTKMYGCTYPTSSNIVIDNTYTATTNICTGTFTVEASVINNGKSWEVTHVKIGGVETSVNASDKAYITLPAFGDSWKLYDLIVDGWVGSGGGTTYIKFKVSTAQYHNWQSTSVQSDAVDCYF